MNIPRPRISNKIVLLFLFIFIVNCTKPRKKISSISHAVEVDSQEYVYSVESNIVVNGQHYSLRNRANYSNSGNLIELISYRPEGTLNYSFNDIQEDPNLLENFGIPVTQKYIYDEKSNCLNADNIDYCDLVKSENLIVIKDSTSIVRIYSIR